jgi:hypothetical protein
LNICGYTKKKRGVETMGSGYIRDLSIQFLLGCTLTNWVKLLWQNRDKPIYIKSLPKFLYITFVIILLTPVRLIEKLLFDIRVKKTKIDKDPIFILGHWRSGTTYLVNMLSQDEQFGVTNAIHCFSPNMFLVAYKVLEKVLKQILPKHRHMDSMPLDTVSSQEEEFAIANMSTLSNYHLVPFPMNRNKYKKYAYFRNMSEEEITEWKEKYLYLIKKVTFQQKGKRLLLKSPTNTGRIKQLLELFPNARFIHICRNPYKVYVSTKRLYDKFFPVFELQERIPEEESEETQFEIYENMYKKYFQERDLIPKGHLIEVRYEDVIKDPLGNIEKMYTQLGLDGFEKAKPAIERYIESVKNYKPNKYKIDPRLKRKISQRFDFTFKKFGYPKV